MELEQLKQENEKLNARLKKAITVFNEQKETIARLTEERDIAVSVVEAKDELIIDLRNKIAEKDADDTKFFEQLQEIDALNEEIQNQKTLYDGLASQNEQFRKELRELEDKHRGLTIDYNSSKSAYKELGNEYKEYVQKTNDKLAQNQDTINELSEKNQDLITALDNLTNRYETTIAQYTALINNMVQMVKDRTVSLVKDVEKLNNPG